MTNRLGPPESGVPDLPRLPVRLLVLVGFMGAGKSSVGPVLGKRLGWQFLDLDSCIEAREGRSVPDLFVQGESMFRQAEHRALRWVLEQATSEPTVLALGGGAFVQPENLNLIRSFGAISIFLDAPVEELWKRCCSESKGRPLMQDENQFRQLYASRRSSYMSSSLYVNTHAKEIQAIADEIVERVAHQLHSQGESGEA